MSDTTCTAESLAAELEAAPTATATVTMKINNIYEDGEQITTTVTATIPLPPAGDDEDDRYEWESEHIRPHTGTGHDGGDAGYFVEIIASDVPELLGQTYEFC